MGPPESNSDTRSWAKALVLHRRVERMATRIGWFAAVVVALMLIASIASIFRK
jgi:hypothetical protein